MIKAILQRKASKRPIVLLGLSQGNINRLTNGEPILVHGQEVGLDADITIVWGATEQAIMDEITAAAGPAEVEIRVL